MNRNIILGVLEKIRRRLAVLEEKEKDVFTLAELKALKGLEHDPKGKDRIIDVLERNDSDPIGGYHQAAKEYCELLLNRLR
jgi:hypothetical protein